MPLRLVIARCLEEWDVTSTDSDDSDDFCGWRVGSRELDSSGRPVQHKSRAPASTSIGASAASSATNSLRRLSSASAAAFAERRAAASRLVSSLVGTPAQEGGLFGRNSLSGGEGGVWPDASGGATVGKKNCTVQ